MLACCSVVFSLLPLSCASKHWSCISPLRRPYQAGTIIYQNFVNTHQLATNTSSADLSENKQKMTGFSLLVTSMYIVMEVNLSALVIVFCI